MRKRRKEFNSILAIIKPLFAEMNRAVFLDRDGVLIEERNYLHRVEDVAFLPGVAAALKRLLDAGFKLFIVSNQSGVGRGYFTLADVERVNEHLLGELARAGVRFEKIYIAPEAWDSCGRFPGWSRRADGFPSRHGSPAAGNTAPRPARAT